MWRVYYDDGSHSDNEVTNPYRMIAVVQPREKTGREVLHRYPYYILKNGVWYGVEDSESTHQQFAYFAKDIDAFLMGIWAGEDNYTAIIRRATEDVIPGIPRRSARDPDRRR